jgi:hypothetical protein
MLVRFLGHLRQQWMGRFALLLVLVQRQPGAPCAFQARAALWASD